MDCQMDNQGKTVLISKTVCQNILREGWAILIYSTDAFLYSELHQSLHDLHLVFFCHIRIKGQPQ